MDMTLRWYGPGYDSVTLKQIRQIPGVKNVITTLFGKQAGELWLPEEIAELKKVVCDAGLLIIILRHYRLLAKLTSIWYVTTLCQCLTGHVLSLQE